MCLHVLALALEFVGWLTKKTYFQAFWICRVRKQGMVWLRLRLRAHAHACSVQVFLFVKIEVV